MRLSHWTQPRDPSIESGSRSASRSDRCAPSPPSNFSLLNQLNHKVADRDRGRMHRGRQARRDHPAFGDQARRDARSRPDCRPVTSTSFWVPAKTVGQQLLEDERLAAYFRSPARSPWERHIRKTAGPRGRRCSSSATTPPTSSTRTPISKLAATAIAKKRAYAYAGQLCVSAASDCLYTRRCSMTSLTCSPLRVSELEARRSWRSTTRTSVR